MAPADAAAWLTEHAQLQVEPSSFACLEGCGFCCTYPPEVTDEELAAIEQVTGLTSTGVDPEGTLHLRLQGDCGGCALLEDRECVAYDARPMHCRLFPFHVYLGRRVEVYANRVCPGLDPDVERIGAPAEDADLHEIGEAIDHAMGAARLERLEAKHDETRQVHERFEQLARERDVWMDPEAAIDQARESVRVTPMAWRDALGPYRQDDPAAFPTMVLPEEDFPWRAWRLDDHTFERFTFTEAGELERLGELPAPSHDEPVPEACYDVLDRLIGYECFAGGVFDRVDHAAYEVHLGDAAWGEMNEVLAELAIRAHLVEAEGLPVTERWVAAAYEPAFYDRPTIGAWL